LRSAAANENGKSSRVFKELATGDRRLLSRRELAAGLSRLGVAFEPAEIHSLFGEFATGAFGVARVASARKLTRVCVCGDR
jgi:hypothetical protein